MGHSATVTAAGTTIQAQSRWRAALWWGLIAAALGLARVGNTQFATQGFPSAGLPWWIAAVAVLGAAAWLSDRNATASSAPRWERTDTCALLGILVVAAVTRLWRIGSYPPPDLFAYEEFQTGAVAYGVYQSWQFPWEFPLANIFPGLSFSLIGRDGWGLRAPFLAGAIIAPAFLFLGLRRLMSLPAAFAGAALLAGARWPAAAARFADEIFFPIWVVALAFWLLVRALQRWRQLDLLAFALVSSDLFYEYTAYRAIPIAAFAFAVAVAALSRAGGTRRAGVVRFFVLVLVVWLIMIEPGLVSAGSWSGSVFSEALNRHAAGRGMATLEQRLSHMWEMTRTGIGVFLVQGDIIPINVAGEPMLDRITGPLAALAVLLAAWHWRQWWRFGLLFVAALTFAGIAFFPNNLYIGRFFVLLVPLFALLAFAFDDVLRWRRTPAWTAAVVCIVAVALAGYNIVGLQRIIDDPGVHESFLVPENTVVAAVHEAPVGARVVMLTDDARNALEQSDYLWYTDGRTGGRPDTLAAALTVDPNEPQPIRWVTQGLPETALLPHLVALVCPHAEARVREGVNEMAAVATVQVENGRDCEPVPATGLTATYTLDGEPQARVVDQIDPALMAHTIPPSIAWPLFERHASALHVEWRGSIRVAGVSAIRLDFLNASGELQVGTAKRAITKIEPDRWQTVTLTINAPETELPIRVTLLGQPGLRPSVRLFWKRADEVPQLIPPQALRPSQP